MANLEQEIRAGESETLAGTHKSVLRNPLIAEAFHRTGAVEVWGRGTNRVIEECLLAGIEPPLFEADADFVVVTFRAQIGPTPQVTPQVGTKWGPSGDQVQVLEFAQDARSMVEILAELRRSNRTKFKDQVLQPLLEAGLLEMTIPDKPRSSRQRYRTTAAGKRLLAGERPDAD